jgi:N-acetylmuramoyl-L-alanine amidase
VKQVHKVCIDIGHGSDTYPPSKGVGSFAEWSFNNRVGQKAKELAELNGFDVYLSQPLHGTEIPLEKRIPNINRTTCEIGFSIHANAGSASAVGHEFWHWKTDRNSRKLATIADANAIALLPNKRRGIKESAYAQHINFGILRATKMPFVLGEFGFFTNPEEQKLLQSEKFQTLCAKVVVKTFCDYFGQAFRTLPESDVTSPAQIAQWKATPLQNLHKDGHVADYEKWLLHLDEPAPTWLVFTMADKLNQVLKER